MTKLILRLFKTGKLEKDTPAYRSLIGRISGIVGIITNIILSAMKMAIGTISGSISITADGLNNLTDATSSVVTLIGFKLSELPPDEHHPFGHARFEYLSGLGVAAMILLIGFELLKSSIHKIMHPEMMEFSITVAVILVLSILMKLWLSAFNRKLAKDIDSSTIMATAVDSRNDVFATGAVLVAALLEYFIGKPIDGFMGLAVALFILYSGISLGVETISPLLGEAANPALCKDIEKLMKTCPMVLGIHDLMVHDYGPCQSFASLHVEMDKDQDPLVCHEMIDDLERKCYEELNVHLVIHYDPVIVGDKELDRMKEQTLAVIKAYDDRLRLHDFRMVPGNGHTNIIFDIPIPADLIGQEDNITKYVESRMSNQGHGKIFAVITYDVDYYVEHDN